MNLGIYKCSEVGRFLSPDTIVPDPMNPQSFNRYTYSLNNPIKYTDSTGHYVDQDGVVGGGCGTRCLAIIAALSTSYAASQFVDNLQDNIIDFWPISTEDSNADENNSINDLSQELKKEIGGHVSGDPGDFDPNDDKGPWKEGDPIDKSSKSGKYPSWETVKSRYWKNRATNAKSGEFSEADLALMRKGNAPKVKILAKMNKTGEIVEMDVSKELHHLVGRKIPNPHQLSNVREMWPWEHAGVDGQRLQFMHYEFIKVLP